MASDDQRTVIMSIHIAKGAIIAVVRRFDHEGLRQVQNSVLCTLYKTFVPDEDLRGRNVVPLQLLHLLLCECSLSLLIIILYYLLL